VLDDVLEALRCPHCAGSLRSEAGVVRCERGHSFDVARQGYLALLPGDAQLGTADSAEMVAARERFLAAGHLDPLAEALADEAARARAPDGHVLDVGGGTGWHAARVLDRLPGRFGIALDLSKHALRRAARAHPRLTAVRCDAWGELPLRNGAAALALNVFAPRNPAELARVLRPDGALVVATPAGGHLGEVVSALGLLRVEARKPERLAGQLAPHFVRLGQRELSWRLRLDRNDARDAALMGPSGKHPDRVDLDARLPMLAEATAVTAAVRVGTYVPRGRG
jgi:23S rRNA (guanine745-N1)-methyltransferase